MWIFGGKYLRVNVLTQFLSCFISVHIHVSHPGGGTRQGAEKNAAEADEAVQPWAPTHAIEWIFYQTCKNSYEWMVSIMNTHFEMEHIISIYYTVILLHIQIYLYLIHIRWYSYIWLDLFTIIWYKTMRIMTASLHVKPGSPMPGLRHDIWGANFHPWRTTGKAPVGFVVAVRVGILKQACRRHLWHLRFCSWSTGDQDVMLGVRHGRWARRCWRHKVDERIVHSTRANHHDDFHHFFMKSFLMNPVVVYISSAISLVYNWT